MIKLLLKMDDWIGQVVDHLVEAVNYWTGLRRDGQIRVLAVVYIMLGLSHYAERPEGIGGVSLIMTLMFGGIMFSLPGKIRVDWILRAVRVTLVIVVCFNGALHIAIADASWDDLEFLGSGACLALIFYASTSNDPKNKSRLKQMIFALIPSGNPQVNLDPIKARQ